MRSAIATLSMVALFALAPAARGLDLTGGPSDTLPFGGGCSVSGSFANGSSTTWTCTVATPGDYVDVYFGIANDAGANGNEMDGNGPTQFEIFRYAGHTRNSITYTSSTTLNNGSTGSSTQPVNTRLVLTLVSGTGTVIDTGGIPSNNSNGDIEKLFRITSDTFSVHVAAASNTSPIPVFGESNSNVYDPSPTPSGTRNTTRVHVAYYYNACGS